VLLRVGLIVYHTQVSNLFRISCHVWGGWGETYLSLPPALRLRSTPAKPAIFTSTSTTASVALPAPLVSCGPWTVHIIDVLPMERYEEPELAGLVDICAWRRRSSFHRRPSRRSLVRG
jgi:hypothetical protein